MRIRPALPADAAVVAGIYHHGWTDSYRGLLPDAYLDALDADACLSRWVSALADHLAAGHQAALVWVLGGNIRGRTFYARAGAVNDGMTRTSSITGGTMADVRYLWDLRGRVPALDHQDTR